MQYRQGRAGNRLSVLGFGCMRFPQKGRSIDLEETEREILEAFKAGVNYFDTAYIYSGSEAALGEILARNGIREKVNVATKLPQYLVGSKAALEKYFREQLTRLRTDYIDYYLMHHLTDIAMWEKLKAVGAVSWLDEKKKSGKSEMSAFPTTAIRTDFSKFWRTTIGISVRSSTTISTKTRRRASSG